MYLTIKFRDGEEWVFAVLPAGMRATDYLHVADEILASNDEAVYVSGGIA